MTLNIKQRKVVGKMNEKIEKLRDWGCDIVNTMPRMLDDEDFYIECLELIPDDPNFSMLETAISEHNISEAFNCAHTLKGVISNVGITPMYNVIVDIVEPLRNGKSDNLEGKINELSKMRAHLIDILNS